MTAEDGRNGRGAVVAGELTMTFHQYLSKAVQDDAQLAAERDRLLLWHGGLTGRAACVRVLPAR